MAEKDKILRTLKYHFGKPESLTWGFLLFIASIFAALFFWGKCVINSLEAPIPTTSLVGFAIFMPIYVFFTFVFPSLLLKQGNTKALVGNYTGTGILIIAILSGLPIMLISTILNNIIIWLLLRGGSKILYPAFFYYGGTNSKIGLTLGILVDTVIPAFGICIFFLGLMWSRFKHSQKKLAYLVIISAYVLFTMDIAAILSSVIVGWWICKLRDKTDGVYAPFLCLVSSRICSALFSGTISKIDIYSIQTFSDIPSSFFYAALPTIFIAVILLAFFTRIFDDYYYKYMGRDVIADDETIAPLTRNFTFGLIISLLIMITIWVLISKGVHL
ncbi:MAG: hypothetical protein MJ093_08130 [Saccharofermentans sp.]|nr:hypothetical protein [Saccharofermentans sp.]